MARPGSQRSARCLLLSGWGSACSRWTTAAYRAGARRCAHVLATPTSRPWVRPYTPSVVTKKRRRRQLARATAERQQVRRAQRAAQRRRRNIWLTVVAAILAVAALVYWIVTHP